MKGATFYHIPGMEICPGWVVESWPSWQWICWGMAKGIAKWTFSRVVFLTIKKYYLELWHHILFYLTRMVPNFATVKLDSRSTWNHRCMLNPWRKIVSIILMCIHMVVSLTIQYSSRLSLHSCVPFMRVLFNFIWVICRNSRVTRELDFSCCIQVRVEYYTRVRFRVFCTQVRLLVLHSSQSRVLHAS